MPLFLNGLGDDESDSDDEDPDTIKEKAVAEYIASVSKTDLEVMEYPVIVDSGAAESALPDGWCPQAAMVKIAQTGKKYTAANGSSIRNKGAKLVSMVTQDGQWHDMNFQVCDATGPLASVHRRCEKGHSVTFNPPWDNRGSFIQNLQTGNRTYLEAKDGVYALETKVAPIGMQTRPSFGRQEQ